MKSVANRRFRELFHSLPPDICILAFKTYRLRERDPHCPRASDVWKWGDGKFFLVLRVCLVAGRYGSGQISLAINPSMAARKQRQSASCRLHVYWLPRSALGGRLIMVQRSFSSSLRSGPPRLESGESARTDLFMIRHDDAGIRVSAPEDDVAPFLAIHDKSDRRSTLTSSWPETSVGSFTGGCWW